MEIGFSGGAVYLRDLGSANGILVNGMKVGGGRSDPATFLLGKKENIIQIGKKNSPWLSQLNVPQEERRYRMVVAGDEPQMRHVVKTLFEHEYDIIEAEDGEEALDVCLRENPDIVILDWQMPKIEGVSVCKHLKCNLRTSHIPVVMLTGRKEGVDRIMGIEAGADDYIIKPPDFEEFQVRINALLSRMLHFRDFNWLTGLTSETGFCNEVNCQLENSSNKKDFEFLFISIQNLGIVHHKNGNGAAEEFIKRIAELLWSESLKIEQTVVGQLRIGLWSIFTLAKNRRTLERSLKENLAKVLDNSPIRFKIKSQSANKFTNFYDVCNIL